MLTTYLCVKCPQCKEEILLCECNQETYAKLPDGNFTAEHNCGWIGRIDPLDVTKTCEMEAVPSFKPTTGFQQTKKVLKIKHRRKGAISAVTV